MFKLLDTVDVKGDLALHSSQIMKLATKQIEQLYDLKTWSLQLETSPILHTCTIIIIKIFYYW